MAKIFVICPVREADKEVTEKIGCYIAKLEEAEHQVHWPPRDTNQNDPHGIQICMDNCDAIIAADEVHIWYDPTSMGSHFDIGMVNALRLLGFRKTVLWVNNFPVNPDLAWDYRPRFTALFFRGDEEVYLWFDQTDQAFLFEGGMLFALLRLGFKKKVILLNDEEVQPTPKKSFANVFAALADGYDIAREDAKCIRLSLTEETGGER